MENGEIGIEQFMEMATEEQKKALLKIAELAKKENDLAKEINKIYDSIKSGGLFDGYAITPIEDSDDAMIVSMKPRNELEEIRRELKFAMINAVKLGMSKVGLIKRNYQSYVGKPIE